LVFKIIDPILQSLLFIFFIYSIDPNGITSYRNVLLALFSLQALSLLLNFFIKDKQQLKNERLLYVTIFCFM
jgi:hypothetical protein